MKIEIVSKVWEKAIPVMNQNPDHIRKDECGAWIMFEMQGRRDSEFGWEIDHIIPIAKGGSDDLENLQPLQWENNVAKKDGNLVCKITADDKTDRIHNKINCYWDIILE